MHTGTREIRLTLRFVDEPERKKEENYAKNYICVYMNEWMEIDRKSDISVKIISNEDYISFAPHLMA